MIRTPQRAASCLILLWALSLSVAVAANDALQPANAAPRESYAKAATQWWADVTALAGDETEGRLAGSRGYMRAASYVVARFRTEGLKPAAPGGYFQSVALEQQTVAQAASTAELRDATGAISQLHVGEDILISASGAPRPARIAAPLVFIGYGLHLPDQQYDDLAGMDLKGKIAVVLSGGPTDIRGSIKSSARFARARLLGALGMAGMITLTTPQQIEIPWVRQRRLADQAGMYLSDPALRDTPDGFFSASIDPDKSEILFKGSGHTFVELCALADASKPLPHFDLTTQLSAYVAARREHLSSPNIVAKLQGSDPRLGAEYVVVSAHLDHLGVGEPVNGDRIYNGAMDDASGVAAVLDIAHRLKSIPPPRRSILFVIFTAEEKGLLGSHYFAARPVVSGRSIVADLNFDMPLPLWPLKSVLAPGADESSLGSDAAAVARARGLTMVPDPLPDRNVFIRTDQFSFVREGIPALAFKFGFAKGTAEFKIEHEWRATRYHSPSDDLEQPGVLQMEAVKLDAYVAALASRIANADSRPTWLPGSIFGRIGGSQTQGQR